MALQLSLLSEAIVKIIGFTVILVFSLVVGRVAGRLIERVLNELELGKMLARKGWIWNLEEKTGLWIRFAFYIAGLIIALNYIGIGPLLYRLVAGVAIFLVLLGMILNIANLVNNLVARLGVKKMNIGRLLEIDGIKGKITRKRLTGLKIVTDDEDSLVIPYRMLRSSF